MVLTLKDATIQDWKNNSFQLQVLQCVLGDSKDIGVDVDFSMDRFDYMKDADVCGFDISADYTYITQSPEGSSLYYPIISAACITMQILEGKNCSQIKTEFVLLDENGEIAERSLFPS